MTRQSITFTEPNDMWLKAQLDSKEYASKSEVINDLIRRARRQEMENEYIRDRLISAEDSGFTKQTPRNMLAEFKAGIQDQ